MGYNMLSIASHYLNRSTDTGRGKGWKTPDLWPLNFQEYQKMEDILDELAKRRMIVFPFAGFFGKSSDFPTDNINQEKYIKYTLARIGAYWNILYNIAGPEPNISNISKTYRDAMYDEDIMRLGNLIDRWDIFGHPLTVHSNNSRPEYRIEKYRNESWLDYLALQGAKGKNWVDINNFFIDNQNGTIDNKPIYAQECFWPGNKFKHGPDTTWTDAFIRKKAYVMLLSGTTINFGDMHGNSSSGFSGHLFLEDRHQVWHDIMKMAWDFFQNIQYYEMKPGQDMVDNGFCLANPGNKYLVYLPDRGKVNVQFEKGKYKIQWINAQNTSDFRIAGETNSGNNLNSPDDGDDWILYLVRINEKKNP